MFITLAAIELGDNASDLLNFLNEDEVKTCKPEFESYLKINSGERETKLKEKINSLVASERWSGLAEIHPAWILEELKKESPKIIGIILRYLPSQHVRYLLENLPPTIRFALPNIIEAFSVPKPILDIIKQRFESRFIPLHLSRSIEKLNFNHLYYLKSNELELFFKDLGMQELATALHGISGKSLNFLLNRLSLKDAKRLQQRIKSFKNVSDDLKKQARYTVLEVEGEHLGPENLLIEIGLAAFAKSISSSSSDLPRLLGIKLPPKISYVLKRYVAEKSQKNQKETAYERQSIILSRISSLAKENVIDQSWGKLFSLESIS